MHHNSALTTVPQYPPLPTTAAPQMKIETKSNQNKSKQNNKQTKTRKPKEQNKATTTKILFPPLSFRLSSTYLFICPGGFDIQGVSHSVYPFVQSALLENFQ